MNVEIISPSSPIWDSTLDQIRHDFYHRSGYLEIESRRIQAEPQAIVIRDRDRVLMLPYLVRDCSNETTKQLFDLISPYGYSGFVVNEEGEEAGFIEDCLHQIRSTWYGMNICSAFIRSHPILNSTLESLSTKLDFIRILGNVVICDLSLSTEKLWQQTRENHRTKINKLKRQGFQSNIYPSNDDRAMASFIQIYEETMTRVNAQSLYFFEKQYFIDLASVLGSKLQIFLVELDDTIVAGSMITESSQIVQYHLGGTKTEFLKQSPTTMMFYDIINWSKQRGNNYFNLGGGLGSREDSLYHFKLGFSKKIKPFITMQMIVNSSAYQELIESRADSLGIEDTDVRNSNFFPAYRWSP
jgi:hypothetical protein